MPRKRPSGPEPLLTPLSERLAQLGNLPARPLPDRPIDEMTLPPLVLDEKPTFLGNLGSLASDVGEVAANTLGLLPLGVNPLGAAVVGGSTLGNLATVGMNFYERERDRRLGPPSQRAARAYGAGIEARIKRNAAKSARRFK